MARTRPRNAGLSLLEVLVALALIGVALLLAMSLLVQEPQVQRRLRAHREALEVLETVHESIRGGLGVGIGTSRVEWRDLYDPPRLHEAALNLVIFSEVEAASPPGLYELTLRARYFVGNQSYDRVLTTRLWRP